MTQSDEPVVEVEETVTQSDEPVVEVEETVTWWDDPDFQWDESEDSEDSEGEGFHSPRPSIFQRELDEVDPEIQTITERLLAMLPAPKKD